MTHAVSVRDELEGRMIMLGLARVLMVGFFLIEQVAVATLVVPVVEEVLGLTVTVSV